jgi:hypothetical protein
VGAAAIAARVYRCKINNHQPKFAIPVRTGLEIAIDYVHRQRLIPRRLTVDELFDEVTRALGR